SSRPGSSRTTSASPRSSAARPGAGRWNDYARRLLSFVSAAHADGPQKDPRGLGQARKPLSRSALHGLGLVHGAHEMATSPSPADL
ncbi:MAG: hypothetical protein LBR53_09470, partial [Deltaproteobacteria bacterium]|nr:hypothetical protein [Deltaproteobacteria bacterium]